MEEEWQDDDWSQSWRIHNHTGKLRKEAEAARDNATSYLQSVCKSSFDPAVREAMAHYEASQRMVEVLTTGGWP